MSQPFILLPQPQVIETKEGFYSLIDNRLLLLDSPSPQALCFTAQRLQRALTTYASVTWEIVAGTAVPADQVGATLSVIPGSVRHPQGYELSIHPSGVHLVAGTPAGLFYGVMTLIQIIQQCGHQLPALRIRDWPDFPHRGVMLDISRDKVPTMETLFALIDLLASWKVNQFQLYTEHTFAYRHHPDVWAQASPLTGEEILALDAYCRERFIDLVPNQNSFGHMRRWLIHDRYRDLAECPHGCDTSWGYFDEPFSLNPLDPRSLDLLRSLYDELLPHFTSHYFNVGCDETVDLGQGRSKEVVEKYGVGRVYLDFLMKIYREVKSRGRTMMFWGDIIVQHPNLVPELPRDVIALAWGYEADHPFDRHGALFAASGVPFYVCPGTSTWNSIAGRTDNALGNLRNAAENGLKHGALGFLNTDWGDNGHWQPLPVSYLGYAYGAAVSWAYEANRDLDVVAVLNRYAFRDRAEVMGRIAYDLGNAYQVPGVQNFNGSILFRILQWSPGEIAQHQGLTEEGLHRTLRYIDEVMSHLERANMDRQDADLVRQEFAWAADMLRHAAKRGLWALKKARGAVDSTLQGMLAEEAKRLMAEFHHIWHARNRPGGFKDSLARMERMMKDYQT